MEKRDVPVWEKYALTIKEASAYSNIGESTLRKICTRNPNFKFLLFVGDKKLIKRKEFERWLENQYIIK